METVLKTAATFDPVTLAEAKTYRRIDASSDDAGITSRIKAATRYVQMLCGIQLCSATFTDLRQCFEDVMPLGNRPAASITQIRYYDVNGASQVLSSAVYSSELRLFRGYVFLVHGQTWPAIGSSYRKYPVEIDYVAGYATANVVPDDYKMAVLYAVAHFDEFREPILTGTIQTELAHTLLALVSQEAVYSF